MNDISYAPLFLSASPTGRENRWNFFLAGFRRSASARRLMAQMRRRSPIPPDRWGPNPERYAFAGALAAIIREDIPWPNTHFIPEDPMRLVLFRLDSQGLFWDHMEIESIFHGLGMMIGRPLSAEEINALYQGSFGDAVDRLWTIKKESHIE